MATAFVGRSQPLNSDGMAEVLEVLKIDAPSLWAVLTVETRGSGFFPSRRPAILFERHVFSDQTQGKFNHNHPDISNPKAGGYGKGGDSQYDRLAKAIALDRKAALNSASWGIGQVMGFNAKAAGFSDVETLVQEMMDSENAQLLGMANFIVGKKLASALRTKSWADFARGYNGKSYAKNKYDSRLAAAYQRFRSGPLPDLIVRAAQIYLVFLDFDPGPIDGLTGKMTRSALNEFQEKNGLPETDEVTNETLAALEKAASGA